MSPTLKKIIAILMICFTSIGILLGLFFLVQTWRIRQPATEKLQAAFTQTSSILQTTITGLEIIDQMVTNVYSSTIYLGDATESLAQTISGTENFFDNAGLLMGQGLVNTITNTQMTLETAQSSALVIDNILTTISSIPLLGLDYNPKLPLSNALGNVSESLDPLQEALVGFQSNLQDTQSNIQTFNVQLQKISQNIQEINANLADSKQVIENYLIQVESLKAWVDNAIVSLPTWVTTLCIFISIFILLTIFVQAAILLQGIYILKTPVAVQDTAFATLETVNPNETAIHQESNDPNPPSDS